MKEKREQESVSPKNVRMFRPENDRMIAGVCLGIASYFEVDVILVRLFFVLFTIFGGSGVLIYIIFWLVIPTESKAPLSTKESIHEGIDEIKMKAHSFASGMNHSSSTRTNTRYVAAFLLIVCGVLFFLNNLGIFDWFTMRRFWPLILVLFGFSILLRG